MSKSVNVKHEEGSIELYVNSYPDSCPLCHRGIDPRYYGGYVHDDSYWLELLFQCPLSDCHHLFIGYYLLKPLRGMKGNSYFLSREEPKNYQPREISEVINSFSKDFIKIHNQSEQAEALNLSEIAGPGFRKSLEFLIKDYITLKRPDKKEDIKNLLLGNVIASYVDDSRIQATAKRAAWLGNDETHYYRKWDDKDLSDLKKLIELTVHWIESVELTEEYEQSMLDDKK